MLSNEDRQALHNINDVVLSGGTRPSVIHYAGREDENDTHFPRGGELQLRNSDDWEDQYVQVDREANRGLRNSHGERKLFPRGQLMREPCLSTSRGRESELRYRHPGVKCHGKYGADVRRYSQPSHWLEHLEVHEEECYFRKQESWRCQDGD